MMISETMIWIMRVGLIALRVGIRVGVTLMLSSETIIWMNTHWIDSIVCGYVCGC